MQGLRCMQRYTSEVIQGDSGWNKGVGAEMLIKNNVLLQAILDTTAISVRSLLSLNVSRHAKCNILCAKLKN